MAASNDQLDLFDSDPGAVHPYALDQPDAPLALPRPIPDGLYLGTSTWTFPGWEGLVYERSYSQQRLAERGLEAYSRHPLFGCVSLDKTYYRPVEEGEYARLASQVPESFRFVVKTPRDLLRHQEEGFDFEGLERLFLEPAARGLGNKLGLILFQFPPGGWRDWGSVSEFVRDLGRLFSRLPKDLSYSLEVRDEELLGSDLRQALAASGVGLCASIHPSLPPMERQLLAVPPPPGTPVMFRWNLRPSLGYEEAREKFRPFNALGGPDPGRRQNLARMIARALEAGRQVYVTVNNKAEGCAPLSLLNLLAELHKIRPQELNGEDEKISS